MSLDLERLNSAIHDHGSIARVLIADIKGSSPREVGAEMLVWRDGQSGSIGGGALEFEALKNARAGQTGISHHALGPELGQCCGGAVTLVIETFDLPISEATYFCRRVEGKKPRPLATTRHIRAIRHGKAAIDVNLSDGWLSERVTKPTRQIWVWGAGHVGRAVVAVLADLPDLTLTWVDTNLDRFPDRSHNNVKNLPVADLPKAMALAPTNAEHLVFTFSHELDLAICHAAASKGFKSCGLIGSATKWARFRKRLLALGHHPAQVDSITCPIGDPKLGKHPAAIAVSVAHSLLSQRDSDVTQRTQTGG